MSCPLTCHHHHHLKILGDLSVDSFMVDIMANFRRVFLLTTYHPHLPMRVRLLQSVVAVLHDLLLCPDQPHQQEMKVQRRSVMKEVKLQQLQLMWERKPLGKCLHSMSKLALGSNSEACQPKLSNQFLPDHLQFKSTWTPRCTASGCRQTLHTLLAHSAKQLVAKLGTEVYKLTRNLSHRSHFTPV